MTVTAGITTGVTEPGGALFERRAARRAARLANARWGAGYVARRLGSAVVTILLVTVIVFVLVRSLGGDIALTVAGPEATADVVAEVREQMGLNRPLLEQYADFATGVIRGDLGTSVRTGNPVLEEITTRLPASLQLAVVATLVGSVAGIALGVVAASRHNRPSDHAISVLAVAGMSIPIFWLGLMLINLFSVRLGWLPVAGRTSRLSIVLPGLTLALSPMAVVARMTRGNVLESLGTAYVRTAHAKGIRHTRVLYRHALGNALIPVTTVIGMQFASLLTGAVLVESVFAWPGLGRYLVDSVAQRDIPAVQGVAVAYAVIYILSNLLVDLLYVLIDPRLRGRV